MREGVGTSAIVRYFELIKMTAIYLLHGKDFAIEAVVFSIHTLGYQYISIGYIGKSQIKNTKTQ